MPDISQEHQDLLAAAMTNISLECTFPTCTMELKTDCNQQDFTFFTEEWRRFSEGSGSTDNKILRDELLTCAEPTLRKTLTNTLGKAKH